MKVWAAIVLMCCPGLAVAQEVYGTESGCARYLTGTYTSDDALVWVQGDRVEFHESTCPIIGSEQVGAGAALMTLECSGEGDTWETAWMVETTSDDTRYVFSPEEDPSIRIEVRLCQ
jgi:hypothetical protein